MDGLNHAAKRLIDVTRSFLIREDQAGLVAALERDWTTDCLELLLAGPDHRAIKLAAYCLGLVGDLHQNEALARLLHHDRPDIANTAEHALWSIWLRVGGPDAQQTMRAAADRLISKEPHRAISLLTGLIGRKPFFAEAYHQRALAHALADQYEAALRDARRATELNPLHFAAWACQGNCHAQTARFNSARKADALDCYRRALQIHPRLDLVRQSVRRLRQPADLLPA